jgi:hypothetical protein
MKQIINLVLSSISILYFISCKHEYIETLPPVSATDTIWQSVSSVNYDKIILKSGFATEKGLLLVGNNHFLEMNQQEELVKSELISKEGIGLSRWNSPIMTPQYFAYQVDSGYQNNTFTIRETANPKIKTTINISKLDTNYFYINSSVHPFGTINDKNQLILSIAYRKWQNSNRASYDNFFLVLDLFKSTDSIGWRFNKLIQVPDSRGFNDLQPARLEGIFPYEEGFYFLSSYAHLKYVSTQTGASQTFFRFNGGSFLPIKDTLYLIGYGKGNVVSIYAKPNNSAEWMGYNLTEFSGGFNGFQFKNIGNQFITFWSNQLWHVTLSSDKKTFSIKEIQNTGLKGASIQDLCIFNDKIYLISGNGSYTKPIKTFFTYKN